MSCRGLEVTAKTHTKCLIAEARTIAYQSTFVNKPGFMKCPDFPGNHPNSLVRLVMRLSNGCEFSIFGGSSQAPMWPDHGAAWVAA
jgi:hypothetical protein